MEEPTWDECVANAAHYLRLMSKVRNPDSITTTQKHIDQWLTLAAEIRLNDESVARQYKDIRNEHQDNTSKFSTDSRRSSGLDRLAQRARGGTARARTITQVSSSHARRLLRRNH